MRSNSLFIFILSFWFSIVAAHSSAAQLADDQVRISEIRVEGNIRGTGDGANLSSRQSW